MKTFRILKFEFGNYLGFSILILGFLILPREASASFLINRPLYIGLTDGLVGYWSFNAPDMAADAAFDKSGQDNKGTLTNGPTRTEGKIGQALSFDGVDDYVGIANGIVAATADYTISAWVKISDFAVDSGAHRRIVMLKDGAGNGISFGTYSTGNNFMFRKTGGTSVSKVSANGYNTGVWYHVAVTKTADTTITIYVNGIADTTTLADAGFTAGSYIGAYITSAGSFSGSLDEVRVYNRALSPEEIKRLYKMGATTKINVSRKDTLKEGLVGYWTFDGPDMAADTAFDRSGNGFNATPTTTSAMPSRTIGKIGQALEFNKTQGIDAGDNLDLLTTPLSISVWVKASGSFTAAEGIVTKLAGGGNYRLVFTSTSCCSSTVSFGIRDAASSYEEVASLTSLELNNWYHVVATYDDSTKTGKIYINGVLNNTKSNFTLTRGDTTQRLQFGHNTNNTNAFFRGSLDEVRIYNRVLSTDEIKRLYKMGATTKINVSRKDTLINGLVGSWTFDGPDMAVDTAFDKSGQNNKGTLTGGPTRTEGKIGQALSFDGVDDRVDLNTAIWNSFPTDNTSFSIGYWFKADTLPAQSDHVVIGTPISSGIGSFWTLTAGATLIGQNFDNVTRTNITIGTVAINKWYHVVYTYDGTTQRGYLDGVASVNTATGDWTSARSFAAIGYQPTTAFYDGLIDDVRIYNRALSTDEIKRLYNLGR